MELQAASCRVADVELPRSAASVLRGHPRALLILAWVDRSGAKALVEESFQVTCDKMEAWSVSGIRPPAFVHPLQMDLNIVTSQRGVSRATRVQEERENPSLSKSEPMLRHPL